MLGKLVKYPDLDICYLFNMYLSHANDCYTLQDLRSFILSDFLSDDIYSLSFCERIADDFIDLLLSKFFSFERFVDKAHEYYEEGFFACHGQYVTDSL